MQVTITWQGITLAVAIVTTVKVLWDTLTSMVHRFERDKEQDSEIKALREKEEKDILDIQAEQAIIVMGILAALKGLKEQGCNGPVTEAIAAIEEHINRKAHGAGND